MLSIIVGTTLTRPTRILFQAVLTVPSIDTKGRVIVTTRLWHRNLTVLANVRHIKVIDGISAITKLLCISKAIGSARDAPSVIVTLVVTILASNISATTSETRLSVGTVASPSIVRDCLDVNVQWLSIGMRMIGKVSRACNTGCIKETVQVTGGCRFCCHAAQEQKKTDPVLGIGGSQENGNQKRKNLFHNHHHGASLASLGNLCCCVQYSLMVWYGVLCKQKDAKGIDDDEKM